MYIVLYNDVDWGWCMGGACLIFHYICVYVHVLTRFPATLLFFLFVNDNEDRLLANSF